MKSITIKQPWAWAIIAGHKSIENRTWTTNYRGPLVVIAGRARDRLKYGEKFLARLEIKIPDNLHFGKAIGIVELIDIISPQKTDDPFAEGPWCWILKNPRRFRSPFPTLGHLALKEFEFRKKENR